MMMHRPVRLVPFVALFGLASCEEATTSVDPEVPSADGGFDGGEPGTRPDGGAGPVLEPCPPPATGPGTTHGGDVLADEAWSLAGSPHRITSNMKVLATVTVDACTTVLVDDRRMVAIGESQASGRTGALITRGQRGVDRNGQPLRRAVVIGASDPSKPWGSIQVDRTGKLDLESTTLRDGAAPGSDQNGGGMVVTYGPRDAEPLAKAVRAVDVTLEKSRGYGFNFQSYTGFSDDSADVTVTGSGRPEAAFPIRMLAGALSTLPTISLEDNAADEVEIYAGGSFFSETIRARGVPYRVSGRFRVGPPADGTATLTIEAGVTLRFSEDRGDSGISVGVSEKRPGILQIRGTAAAPVRLTSAKAVPAAGDWRNIYFSYTPGTSSKIEHAIIEYAGAPSGAQGYGCGPAENDASVLILSGRPDAAFIQNTTFQNGGGDTGLLLGWISDQSGPDFVSTNTFTSMPACKVSRWRNASGVSCPGSNAGSPVCLL